MKPKLFVVRQYIMAKNATEAIKKAKRADVHEVWVDEEWSKGNRNELASAMGFVINKDEKD